MKKIFFSSLIISILFSACNSSSENKTGEKFSAAQIAEESKRANEFFDRVFDAKIDRHPMQQSVFGIKKDYGKWQDISEMNVRKEVEITKANLDSLHTNFKLESLDEQTKISYRLFEKACEDA